MKKQKLIKNIIAISSLPIICTTISALSSCKASQDGSKPVDPSPKHLIKLNTNVAPIDINNAIESTLPLTVTSNSDYSIPVKIANPFYETIAVEYRVGDVGGTGWSNWTSVEEGMPLRIPPTDVYQFRAYPLTGDDDLGTFSNDREQIRIVFGYTSPEQVVPGKGISIKGSLASLLCKKPKEEDTLEATDSLIKGKSEACFFGLFQGSSTLINVSPYLLPFKTIQPSCYKEMFEGCTLLAQSPELPATTLETDCYAGMFKNCISLPKAPHLPATTLIEGCYVNMFENCVSLRSASIGYIGNFDSTYFKNWLGGTLQQGVLFYNGIDTEKSENAIPQFFQVKQDEELIKNATVTFRLEADANPVTSVIKGKSQVRCYKDDKATAVASAIAENVAHVAKAPQTDSFDGYYVGPEKEAKRIDSVFFESTKTAQELYAQTTGGLIVPKYGFHPQIDNNYCNVVFHAPTRVEISRPAGSTLYYKNVTKQEEWKEVTATSTQLVFSEKQHVLFKGYTNSTSSSSHMNIKFTVGEVELAGSVMSLAQKTAESTPNYIPNAFCFYGLFEGSTALTKVSSEFLYTPQGTGYAPITDLEGDTKAVCYGNMFKGCTNLAKDQLATNTQGYDPDKHDGQYLPKLPATKAGKGTYYHMFDGCTSIKTFGEIAATSCQIPYKTTISSNAFYMGAFESMFAECKNLVRVANKEGLKVTNGIYGMYHRMFRNSGIVTAPKIAITSMDVSSDTASGHGIENAYKKAANDSDNAHYGVCTFMFESCTHLTTPPPMLTPTKIGKFAYRYMFGNCNSMTATPKWGNITTVYKAAMEYMFYGCSAITTCSSDLKYFNDYGAYCMAHMFDGCKKMHNLPIFPNKQLGDRESSPHSFDYMYNDCRGIYLYCYRGSVPSGYTFCFTGTSYGTVARMAEYANGMFKICSRDEESKFITNSDSHSWTHKISDAADDGTPDYSTLGKKPYYYAFKAKY